jgi:hypothetical protein
MTSLPRTLTIGLALLVLGTVADLAFHAVTEPEEAFDLSLPPIELADHLAIALGVVVSAVGVVVYLVRR